MLYFHFLFKFTKTEVSIYRYVDGDSQTHSYKNVLQTYAANLHKGPAGAVHHKFNAFSFHYTTDYAASFSFT